MASFIFSKTLILFLAINLLLFSLVSACGQCGSGNPNPNPNPNPYPNPNPNPKPTPKPSTPYPGTGGGRPSTGGGGSTTLGACPRDALKLGVCANVLNGLLNLNIGKPPKTPCCPLIQGLVDAEAAVCLCTAIKANILGINLNIPISLSLLVNYCGTSVPRGFQCA